MYSVLLLTVLNVAKEFFMLDHEESHPNSPHLIIPWQYWLGIAKPKKCCQSNPKQVSMILHFFVLNILTK